MQGTQIEGALATLLDWYRAIGVDQAVGEVPVDWRARGDLPPGHGFKRLAMPEPTPTMAEPSRVGRPSLLPQPAEAGPTNSTTARPSPPMYAPRAFSTGAPDAVVMAARTVARDAATLDQLAATLAGFDGCGLKATAKNLCFYRGSAKARLMLIGEAPGREEDLEGKPFVGRAGQLLDKMLTVTGITEQDVHITNIVYWRPPGNRTPTPQEAQVCRPFLERQVELVAPDLIVLLGGAAAKHVLDVAEGIMRIRGKLREVEIGSLKVRAMATLHPAYLLRTPVAKRLAWRDLLAIRAALGG
jgi:uracil-DNA glycosylase